MFALCNIPQFTELRFDYGGGESLPWRKVSCFLEIITF